MPRLNGARGSAVATKERKSKQKKEKKLSRLHRPEDMSLEQWQTGLRRQYGREQPFEYKNTGDHPIFSEFLVTNPESKNTYRISIRGQQPGDNFCSCPDFSTNQLATCKHIEFMLATLERKRGGKKALREGYQPPYSEIYVQYGARREVRFRPGSECPVELARLSSRYFDSEGVLTSTAHKKFDKFLGEANKIEHDLRCYEDALGLIAEMRDTEIRRKRIDDEFPRGIRSAAFKKLLKVNLYDYQRQGTLFAARAGRALIGDEMGLGKTIQAIAAAEILGKFQGVEHVLIICPTSLKHQWEREIERFTNRSVTVVNGLRGARQNCFQSDAFFMVTNYDTIHTDLDLIEEWSPELVILDEAQRIKNWATRVARSVKKISSPYALVLTGTPLENRLEELVSIIQFVDQYRLGPTYQFLHDHQIQNETGRVIGYRELDKINQTLQPVLIRRKKQEVLKQLPERIDKNFFVPMTEQQNEHHAENRELVSRIVQKWRRYKFLSEKDKRLLMVGLQNMRMSCNSTYLLDGETDYGVKADELATLLEEIYEQPDVKVVIFSQWLRTHELILRRFSKRNWNNVLFHGGVPSKKRKGLVDRFRSEDDCRAFLSTDAGGVGLNLQHASVVINMDLPWNPAVLEQRIGRVHRLGQEQPVRVVNFVAQGTIEQGMLEVLRFKKSLFSGALDGGAKEVFMGGTRLNRFMEGVEKATGAIPQAEVNESFSSGGSSTNGLPASIEQQETEQPTAIQVPVDPGAALVQTGLEFLNQLSAAIQKPSGGPSTRSGQPGLGSLIQRDERTGEQFFKLPVPQPDVLEKALSAFSALLDGMNRR